jgi:mRNA-degrading endonuclease RelE of RelBE toxin-antitoxin system
MMIKYFYSIFAALFFIVSAQAQTNFKGTIAVDSFKLQPVSVSTQSFVQQNYQNDVRSLGDSFAALFTDRLRKAGFSVVTRKNIDTLFQENQLGQTGLADDEGSIKLRTADYRIIGTIRQFEESEKSNGTALVAGALLGTKIKQAQAVVEVVVEMIARDGTVIASSTGKANKDGRMTSLTGVGAVSNNKVFGIFNESSKDFKSNAMSSASSAAIDNAIKDLTKQVKNMRLEEISPIKTTENNTTYNFNKTRVVVSFPESMVAEEVFSNALSDSNAKIVLGTTFTRSNIQTSEALSEYCKNLARVSGNAKLFIYGVIDSERVNTLGQSATRITMSVRAMNLNPYQVIYSDSIQAAVADVSNKAGYDRAVKEASTKLINRAISKISIEMSKIEDGISEDSTYTINLSGFQSLSSANRFLNLLRKNSSILNAEVVDFSGNTLFAEIKVDRKVKDLASLIEKDSGIVDMFSVTITSVNDKKIIGNVITR